MQKKKNAVNRTESNSVSTFAMGSNGSNATYTSDATAIALHLL